MSIVTEGRRNGVDTATLFATIEAVQQQPEAGAFQFRTITEWVSGTHSRGRFPGFSGAGQEHTHAVPGAGDIVIDRDVRNGFSAIRATFEVDGDSPETLASLVAQSEARSAVLDVLTSGTAVAVEVVAA